MSYPMTPEGYARIKTELGHLKTVRRPEVIRSISEARSHGDLKENAEYHAAKDDQAMLEARIAQLETAVNLADVIDISDFKNNGRVIFGSTITLQNLDNDEFIKMRIVGELEADFSKGTVSSVAPLVKVCLGRSVGDTVEFLRGKDIVSYSIEAVEYIA